MIRWTHRQVAAFGLLVAICFAPAAAAAAAPDPDRTADAVSSNLPSVQPEGFPWIC